MIDAAKHALVDGWVQSIWVGVGMVAVAVLLLVVRGPLDEPTDELADVEVEVDAAVPAA